MKPLALGPSLGAPRSWLDGKVAGPGRRDQGWGTVVGPPASARAAKGAGESDRSGAANLSVPMPSRASSRKVENWWTWGTGSGSQWSCAVVLLPARARARSGATVARAAHARSKA